MKTTLRRAVVISLLTLLVCGAVLWMLPFLDLIIMRLRRHDGPAETLQAPSAVRQITPEGLVLANGALLKIPYVQTIPTNLPVLVAATQSGVAVEPTGHVIGLIKVWHWCGNDPVRSHVGRIDLTGLLIFAGAAPTEAALTNVVPVAQKVDLRKWGLNISQYSQMNIVAWMVEEEHNKAAKAKR
ncbi:MAG: hypothetical protein NTY53_22495 [Kiritimatiellaeota bacterium]|nr:hypothetical protein [Kiritimatiellota bacterium]